MKDRLKKKLNRFKNKPTHKPNTFPTLAIEKVSSTVKSEQTDSAIADAMENTENLFIIIKNDTPHLFEEFKNIVFQDMPSDEIEEFYARVALKEAYQKCKMTEPPPAYKTPKRKVYEMPAAYQQHLEHLTKMIESRNEYTRLLPTLLPEARAEATPILRQLSDSIEDLEEKLAVEYERYQEEKETEEYRLSVIKAQSWMDTARQFLFIKKYKPHTLEAFKAACMEDEEWVDIARWIDRLESEGYDSPPVVSNKEG